MIFRISMSSMLKFVFAIMIASNVQAQMFATSPMGGSYGCVVTGTKLYSHGNYIRDLNATEMTQLTTYKTEMKEFQKKIDATFQNFGKLTGNTTFPPLPQRPNVPDFCTGKDTILYVFPGCVIQNNKVYIGQKYARDLAQQEIKELNEFAKEMAANNANAMTLAQQPEKAQNPPTPPKIPDFCIEF